MLQIDAVNRMLTYIGEIRLAADTNLDTLAEGSDGQVALQALEDCTRDVQLRGWWFNTFNMTLAPDVDGYIAIPLSWLKVTTPNDNYIVDNHKLFDRDNESYLFDDNVEAIVVVDKPFDDLPETVANYITFRASKDLSLRTLGMSEVYQVLAREEAEAQNEMYKENVENNQLNLVDAWGITDPTTSN